MPEKQRFDCCETNDNRIGVLLSQAKTVFVVNIIKCSVYRNVQNFIS